MHRIQLLFVALLLLPTLAHGQGAFESMGGTGLKPAKTPEELAAALVSRGERFLAQADEQAAEAAQLAAAGNSEQQAKKEKKARSSYEGARRAFSQALSKDPAAAPAHLGSCRAFLGLGQKSEARGACEEAWRWENGSPEVGLWLARAYLANDEVGRSLTVYKQLAEKAPAPILQALRQAHRDWVAVHPGHPQAAGVEAWLTEEGG